MNDAFSSIDWYDNRVFKVWNYKYTAEHAKSLIVDALAVLLGEYDVFRKQAALLLLKILVRDDFLKFILQTNADLFPFERSDPRVRIWTKKIISKGFCEICGTTERLEAHHIIKWADFPQGRIDEKNGLCLCHNCHTEEHKHDQSYHMMKAGCS